MHKLNDLIREKEYDQLWNEDMMSFLNLLISSLFLGCCTTNELHWPKRTSGPFKPPIGTRGTASAGKVKVKFADLLRN